MKLVQDETDFRQIRHQQYQLHYKQIRVEGAEYALHSRNGRLELAHGRIVENLSGDVSKFIPEQQALDKVLTDPKKYRSKLLRAVNYQKAQDEIIVTNLYAGQSG